MKSTSNPSRDPTLPTPGQSQVMLVILGCLLTLGVCVGARLLPIGSLRLIAQEAWPSLLIGLAALGIGSSALICMGLGGAALRWRIVLGSGLGFGLIALLMLGLGVSGHLSRNLWLGIVGGAACIGAGFLIHALIRIHRDAETEPHRANLLPWLWLLAMPALGLGIFAASFPPGILWYTEGNGYDVLEYHFGAPREYYDAGRIAFLPHNIYSNFPFNVEMVYLLTFVLRGGPHRAAIAAQVLNVLLGIWAVAAAWLAGRTISRLGGHVAGLLTATCPWLAWLCGVAYVENGLLMFAGLAFAAFVTAIRSGTVPGKPARWMVAAGLAAGLACGCKYTAIPMVAAPLMAAAIVIGIQRKSWLIPIAFGVAAAVSFAPWLIKNAVYTGNPVFPLARSVFPERPDVWTPDGAARWHEGHLPDPDHRSVSGRLSAISDEVIHRGRFGWVLYAAVAASAAWLIQRWISRRGPVERRANHTYLLAAWCVICGLGVWLFATHLQDRFLIPILVPAVLLVALALDALPARFQTGTTMLLLVGLCAGGLYRTYDFFDDDRDPVHDRVIPGPLTFAKNAIGEDGSFEPLLLSEAIRSGDYPGFEHLRHVIDCTERGGRVLMIGDARCFYLNDRVDYCVVFNRNPLEAAARRYRPRRVIEWLRERGYTYVYVDWAEMNRLRKKSRYGFWEPIDEAFIGRLVDAGLQPIEHFRSGSNNTRPRATLFRIPEKPPPDLRMM